MKRFLSVAAVGGGLLLLAGVATAQMWGGPGGRGMGPRMMGPGGGAGPGVNCPGAQQGAQQITDEDAKKTAQEYADKYLAGFKVDKVLPFTGMRHTMYSVELKNDKGEVRTLRINPFGGVMPFARGWARGA